MARKKKNIPVDPDYLRKQKAARRRTHRQVLCLNDSELAALEAYCQKFKIHSKSALMREIVMERIISEMEENHPTLF